MTALVLDSVSAPGRLDGVSLELQTAEVVAVVGRNGAGKSSMLAAILGHLQLSAGQVRVDGRPASGLSARERAAFLGWLPQQPGDAEGLTAVEVVAAARFRFAEPWRVARRRAAEALAHRGMDRLADRRMARLSGGERQRVRLAGLSAQDARFWLLDEPANHLDPAARIQTWRGLAAEVREGRGILLVTHDVGLLDQLSGVPVRVLALHAGAVRWTLPLDHPELSERLGELLGLRIARASLEGVERLVVLGGAP